MFGKAAKTVLLLVLFCSWIGFSLGAPGSGTARAEDAAVAYEAEAAGNTLTGNASVADCAACSGGKKVGGLYQGASLQFNGVTVAEAGAYKVTVSYVSGDPRSANVSVNGGEKEYVEFPATANWDTVGSYDVTLELQAGTNTITFDDNNWYAPDIDRIVVAPASGSDPGTTPGVVYEAEAAGNVLTGNAAVSDCGACSGGKKVGGLYGGSSLLFPDVTAEAAGDYEIELSFISGDPRAFYVTVNDGESQLYDSLKTADWNTLGTYKLTVPLQAGGNRILFSDGNGYSPDLDRITVRPATQAEQPGADEGSIGDALTPVPYGAITVTPYTAGAVITNGSYSMTYHSATGYADYEWPGGQKVTGVSGQMKLDGQTLQTTDYETHSFSVQSVVPIHDGFGQGIEVVFVNEAAGKPTLKQVYDFYEGRSYFLTRLDAVSETAISTNYMAPIAVSRPDAVKSGQGTNDRVLTVPFDNDAWIRFKAQSVNRSDTSYEVTAVYDNDSRTGLILGSVTHDKWKTGIDWSGSGGKLNKMTVYGGASSSVTHDSQPHGSLSGTTVSSPTILAGGFADYRTGLEEYGKANAVVAPPLPLSADLPQGVPVGWNSWGAFGSGLSYQDVVDTSNYFHDHLPLMNNDGATYVNLDSYWDNLSDQQLGQAVSVIKGNGQNAGIYWGPFVYWGNNMSQTVEGTDGQYTYGDIVLKDANGNPLPTLDGAYALDPTNPGTKERIDYYLGRFKNLGFTYIKLDFLTHGSLEGVHADPAVTTGIQAYNEGMAYIDQALDGSMFISESISPIFPSQYAHSRRISCDTYGQINETEYELNSLTYGWWQNGTIYRYTDPDHMALSRAGSLTEARSRVNSAVISGTVFLDSDDVNDPTARQYMTELYGNPLVNGLAVRGEAFRPVEGNTNANAADTFVLKDGDSAYVAVFNYSGSSPAEKTIDLSRLGLSADAKYTTLDLWTGERGKVSGTLSLTLQPAESRLIKIAAPTCMQPKVDPCKSTKPK
ncbi:CBM35 domain-containing protein [Cohnella zeiphila]|uniref:Carbohydrate-binding protein n=1 Tax=Cohnella zeiphila TaxID=2761120 RepID=A0A7X0SHM3_9BACL|nr:CBM35 domain-containing protein [Cohnella zeiphila]MBB6730145.1 carbohydrate-binding protein [Cohnella zeiphila]